MVITTGAAIGTEAGVARSSTTITFTSLTTTYSQDEPAEVVTRGLDTVHRTRDTQVAGTLPVRSLMPAHGHQQMAGARTIVRTTVQFLQPGRTTRKPQDHMRATIQISPNQIFPRRAHFPTTRAGSIRTETR